MVAWRPIITNSSPLGKHEDLWGFCQRLVKCLQSAPQLFFHPLAADVSARYVGRNSAPLFPLFPSSVSQHLPPRLKVGQWKFGLTSVHPRPWHTVKSGGIAINPRRLKPCALQHLHITQESCGTLQLWLTELVVKFSVGLQTRILLPWLQLNSVNLDHVDGIHVIGSQREKRGRALRQFWNSGRKSAPSHPNWGMSTICAPFSAWPGAGLGKAGQSVYKLHGCPAVQFDTRFGNGECWKIGALPSTQDLQNHALCNTCTTPRRAVARYNLGWRSWLANVGKCSVCVQALCWNPPAAAISALRFSMSKTVE